MLAGVESFLKVFGRPGLERVIFKCAGLIFSVCVRDHADDNNGLFLCVCLSVCVCARVCVCQGDHATVRKELERAALPHLCHGPGGVPVFRRSCVWLGFIGVCPQVRELLQLSVRQHNRRQRNPGLRWVSPPHIYPSRVAERCPTSQKRFQKQFAALAWLIFLVCVSDCSRQDEQFSLVFTIASFMNNFMTLLSGFLFDHFGTMVTRFCAVWVQLPQHHKKKKISGFWIYEFLKPSRKSWLWGMWSLNQRFCYWTG